MPRLEPTDQALLADAMRLHRRRLEALELGTGAAPIATPPANPVVGQRWTLPHATGVWEMAWTGSQWVFVGGSDLVGFTAASVATASPSYPAAPQGPNVTLPRTGTFDVWIEAMHQHSHTAVLFTAAAAQTGAAGTAFGERAPVLPAGTVFAQGWWASAAAGVALAAGNLGCSFRSPNSINCTYSNRLIRVRPRSLA